MSTPYQPDPNQGQGSSYQPTQYTPVPQYGQPPAQPAQAPQYGQAAQYGQEGQQSDPPQWGQQGQTPPQYGQPPQAPQYGQPPQAPQYGQTPQYGQAPQYGQPPQAPQYGQQPPQALPYQAQQYGQPPGYGQGAYGAVPNFSNAQRTPYLSGGSVDFMTAMQEALKNAFVYEGRASRSAYWWNALGVFGAFVVLEILAAIVHPLIFIVYLLALAVIVVTLPLAVRRLHDTGKSGFWFFIDFVPLIGGIWLLVLLCQPSNPGPNQYGDKAP